MTNPNYTADYHYARHRVTRDEDTNRVHVERRPQKDWLSIPNHHEPYVSREDWERIQSMLSRHARGRQPAPGRGSGLLQGLLVCGRCGSRWMRTAHDSRAPKGQPGRGARYSCVRVDRFGELVHQLSGSAAKIDHAIVQLVLERITPVDVESALAALREDEVQREAALVAHRRLVQRGEEHVIELRRHFLSVDPANRMVKVDLEAQLEAAMKHARDLQQSAPGQSENPTVPAADQEALLALVGRLSDLWHAPTTTVEDRKHLLRAVLSKVILHELNAGLLDLELVWASGLSERRQVLKARGTANMIHQMRAEGRSLSEIADTLAELRVTTQANIPFSRKVLGHRLWLLGLGGKGPRREALRLIRSMLVDRRCRREILDVLRTHGPQPYNGEWTSERVSTAIKSIMSGHWAPDILPLPPGIPRVQVEPEAVALLVELSSEGKTWGEITDELNRRGFHPVRTPRYTYAATHHLYRRIKRDPVWAPLLPASQEISSRRRRRRRASNLPFDDRRPTGAAEAVRMLHQLPTDPHAAR